MKYLRRTAGYTLLDHKRNEDILEELHVTSLQENPCTHRHNWFQHVHRTGDYRLPKRLLNYHPKQKQKPFLVLLHSGSTTPVSKDHVLLQSGRCYRTHVANHLLLPLDPTGSCFQNSGNIFPRKVFSVACPTLRETPGGSALPPRCGASPQTGGKSPQQIT
jgi:hypothetical protein